LISYFDSKYNIQKHGHSKKTIGMQLPRSLFPSNMSLSAQVELAKN